VRRIGGHAKQVEPPLRALLFSKLALSGIPVADQNGVLVRNNFSASLKLLSLCEMLISSRDMFARPTSTASFFQNHSSVVPKQIVVK